MADGKTAERARRPEDLNDTHVNAMDDPVGCASGLVQTFIRDPAALQRMNASCAERTPEVRVVGTFPATLPASRPPRPGRVTGPGAPACGWPPSARPRSATRSGAGTTATA
jgi:hypothetical protein